MTKIDAYPWPVPTEEQKAMFDNLSSEQQMDMLRKALIKGEESGVTELLDMEKICRKARQKMGLSPREEIL